MSEYSDLFTQHNIHRVIRELKGNLDREIIEINSEEIVERRRCDKYITLTEKVINLVDPELISNNHLDSLENTINNNVLHHLQQYKNTGEITHLKDANAGFTECIQYLSQIRIFSLGSGGIKSSNARNQRQVDEFSKLVSAKNRELNKEFNKLSNNVSSANNNIEALNQGYDVLRTQATQLLAAWQQQFSDAQEERRKEYTDRINALEKDNKMKLDQITDDINKDFNEANRNYREKLIEYHNDARDVLNKIDILHGLAAAKSVVGGHMRAANIERYSGWFWRIASIAFIIVAALWLYCSAYNRLIENIMNWQSIFTTLPLTGVLIFGAVYSAQQATRHRIFEIRIRRFALEMAAIDPYLESLEDGDRVELKKELAKRFFGQPETVETNSMVDEHAVAKVADSLASNFIKLVMSKFLKS